MRTKDKLAAALEAAGAPASMIENARGGFYDDYDSPLANPIGTLVAHARNVGLESVAQAAIDGEFNATREESEAWARRVYATDPEMRALMDATGLGPRPEGGPDA